MRGERAQANLAGLAAALVILATVTTGSVALATGALAEAETGAADRHAAATLAERLVAPGADHARRANAVDREALETLNATDLDRLAPPVRGRPVRVRVGGETVVERGDPEGPTVRRLVRVERTTTRTATLNLSERRAVSLPNRTDSVALDVTTDVDTDLTTVRANDRIVLYDRSGLFGGYEVETTRIEPPTLEFTTEGGTQGTVTVRWTATNATVEPLAVTVDA